MGDAPAIKTENMNLTPSADPNAVVRLGGEVLRLQDKSYAYPVFSLFDHFVKWLQKDNPNHGQSLQLYYSGTSIVAYDVEDLRKFGRDSHPMAKMTFEDHPVLTRLKKVLGSSMSQSDAEKWLVSMRRHLVDDGGKLLLLKARDLQLAKTFTMERVRTPTGWSVAMKMEGGSTGDFCPPESIKVSVPLFKSMNECGAFNLDFQFDFEVEVQSTKTFWLFSCPTWQEDYLDMATQVIGNAIANANLDIPVFAGTLVSESRDNSWSFVHNRPEGLRKGI